MTKYWLRAYYGPGGRQGGENRVGEREGDLVVEVWNKNKSLRDVEVDILRKREDVGVINTWETDY